MDPSSEDTLPLWPHPSAYTPQPRPRASMDDALRVLRYLMPYTVPVPREGPRIATFRRSARRHTTT